jgi:hypothetical protein
MLVRPLNQVVMMDSTHGTNQHGFSLFTLLVMDEYGNGLPAGWCITSNEKLTTIALALSKLKDAVHGWTPRTFIVDDADAEIGAIRATFPQCKILLCLWHVKRSWIKNLLWKVNGATIEGKVLRVTLMQDLNRLVAFNPQECITDEQCAQLADQVGPD